MKENKITNEELVERSKSYASHDEHEDHPSSKKRSINEKSEIGYNEEIKILNQKFDVLLKEAQQKYDAYLRSNTALTQEEKNEKHHKLFDPIFNAKEKHAKEIAEKYGDEIQYKINPKLSRREELINSDVLLSVRHLKQYFTFGSKIHNVKLKAVSNVSFDVHKGECFGIVGESGCGKTTTGRTIIKLYKPTSGSIYYRGYRIGAGSRWNEKEIKWKHIKTKKQIAELKKNANREISKLDSKSKTYEEDKNKILTSLKQSVLKAKKDLKETISTERANIRRIKFDQKHTPRKLMNEIQMIFQDPVDSLDPRMTVKDIIEEGLLIQGHRNRKENYKKIVEMLEKVGLVEEHAARYPHEFSGGQRQRIGIARALVMNPKLLICDEPISALDVSIRAQVINLLNDLKEEMGLTLIFIAHDLSVVKYFCDRIAVMYFGKLVELASSEELFKHPLHPYTTSLLSAIPKPNPLTERHRTRIIYNPQTAHDYSVDKPILREVCPGHMVYCNEKELKEYQAKIKKLEKKSK